MSHTYRGHFTDLSCFIPVAEDAKENPTHQDHLESLIDHSQNTKPILKPTASGSSLKRSTSQPNLSEDANAPHKPLPNSDSTLATHSSRQIEIPALNRQNKPRYFIYLFTLDNYLVYYIYIF